ncbi:hypothetical protein A2U01_0069400, partial [Trifolium medium]|nr:hypothetical protein [Trifolium medium]
FLHVHHKSDTETVVSPTPPEVLHGNQELLVTKLLVGTTQSLEERGTTLGSRKRHLSCPPGRGPSVLSGSWSLEWLKDHTHCDAGIIFHLKRHYENARTHLR